MIGGIDKDEARAPTKANPDLQAKGEGPTMTATSVQEPTRTDTREARGLRLAESRFDEIYPVSPGTWAVPSCSDSSVYLVKPRHESCTCPDHKRTGRACKHVFAAYVVRAKTAECSGCGGRSRRRDLVEVLEEDHLTFFEGDQLCRTCADNAGVAY
jgi:hypothetical protein